jgi:tetratricopeptide (TPR) repeat protein
MDDKTPTTVWIPAFKLTEGIFFQYGRNLSLSFASLSQALTSFEKLDTPSHLAETLQALGYANYGKGKHDTALEYYQRSLALYEKLEHDKGIANVLLYMGFIYLHKGEIDTMAEYYYRSLTFAEASGCPVMIASALRYIGQAHYYKSEFDTALGYSQRALALSESISDKSGMHDVFSHLGLTHYMIGELDQALDYFQRGLTLNVVLRDDVGRAKILTGLIRVTLARQDRVQAQTYLSDLQTVAARNPNNRHIQFRSSLMEALVSKASPRMRDKVHAQMLLRQLVTEENFEWRWQLAMLGLLHLCDLLIFEARATGEGEAWEEAKTFLEQFYTRAQDKKDTEFMAEALLLQAKFALIDGELQQAQTYLTEAKTVATELDRSLLIARVEAEQTQLTTDFTKWTNLIRRNAPLQERLTEARLEEYLQKVKDALVRMS